VAELGTQYTLVDFGRRAGVYGQAETTTRIQALTLERTRQGVAFQVVNDYLQVLGAEARLLVLMKALERSRTIREDAGAKRRQGDVETESVALADVGVTRSEVEIVSARQSVFDARSLLGMALGRPGCASLALADERRLPSFERTLDQCLEVALRGRGEIEVARQQVAYAGFGEESARGDFLPKVTVRAGLIRADAPKVLHTWITGAGVFVEQEIFAGGRIKGQLRGAKAAAAEAFAGLRVITNNVTNQVNLAYSAIGTARARVRLGEVELIQSHENLRVLLVRYRNGDAILSDIIAAETSYTGAGVNYVTTIYDYLTALGRLDYAQGDDQVCLLDDLARTPEAPWPRFEKPLPSRSGPLPSAVGQPPEQGGEPGPDRLPPPPGPASTPGRDGPADLPSALPDPP